MVKKRNIGYESEQNRRASGVLDIAYDARKEAGVLKVVINIPLRNEEQMCREIVIR